VAHSIDKSYSYQELPLLHVFDYPDLMFIALYEFQVKPGFENQFEENWSKVTEAIYTTRGSLGSRLHKASDGTYVAYAQWPSEELYKLETPLPEKASIARGLMKDACVELRVLKLMTVQTDLLKD
jgi:quinol monooxygenase YgiN